MTSRTAVKLLLALVLALPVLLAAFGWVAGLLAAMGDAAATTVLRHLSTGLSVLWLVSVVGLLIALAVETLDDTADGSGPGGSGLGGSGRGGSGGE